MIDTPAQPMVSRQPTHVITLFLRNAETGAQGTYDLEWYGDEEGGYDGLRFWLRDGNGGCDCNRSNWLDGSDLPCSGGKNRVVIEKAQNEHGTVVYTDEKPYRQRTYSRNMSGLFVPDSED